MEGEVWAKVIRLEQGELTPIGVCQSVRQLSIFHSPMFFC